jgi:transposase
MKRHKPVYAREFKLAILARVNSGLPVAQVARENGLHPALVFRWKNEYMEDPEKAFAGPGNPYKDQARIAELERIVVHRARTIATARADASGLCSRNLPHSRQ